MQGTLPVSFRGTTYAFPISIWIPQEYPKAAPLGFITPTADMIVRPGQYVSGEGKIYHPYLAGWRDDVSNMGKRAYPFSEAMLGKYVEENEAGADNDNSRDVVCPDSFPSCRIYSLGNHPSSLDKSRYQAKRNFPNRTAYLHQYLRCLQSLEGRIRMQSQLSLWGANNLHHHPQNPSTLVAQQLPGMKVRHHYHHSLRDLSHSMALHDQSTRMDTPEVHSPCLDKHRRGQVACRVVTPYISRPIRTRNTRVDQSATSHSARSVP